ncbi:MAG: ATP-dependent DNA helicase RecG [Acidimicrobiales bacterium]
MTGDGSHQLVGGGAAQPVGPGPHAGTSSAGGPQGGPSGRKLRQLSELDVSVLSGVGPAVQAELARLGIGSVLDLLTHYPRRYVDGTRLVHIAEVVPGDRVSVLAEVTRVKSTGPGYGRGRRRPPSRVVAEVADGTGTMSVVFFNQPWRSKQLAAGTLALFFGEAGTYRGSAQMVAHTAEVLRLAGSDPNPTGGPPVGRVYPVYPLSERTRLTSARIGRFVDEALDRAGTFADPLDPARRDLLGLVDRTTAFNGIHRPGHLDESPPARRRLAFDELFRLQLALVLRQHRLQVDSHGLRHVVARADGTPTLFERFLDGLPFRPTAAQMRAIEEIRSDLAGPLPMHRLLQGDVGAGKTVVALAALLMAVEGGHQGAFMAPTEVLAEQHAASIVSLLSCSGAPDQAPPVTGRPPCVELLTAKTPPRERARIHAGLLEGTVDLLVGTHALLTDQVSFHSLGAVVIDEQHRFGVEQRAALRAKGRGDDGLGHDPDLLVMTATPIPRTAAMVVFGDLDRTVIDELPPGRQPVTTRWARTPLDAEEAWARVRSEVTDGHRAFVVCPLVEGSSRVEATSVVAEAERLAGSELRGISVGLLHGQMPVAEKQGVMDGFRQGRYAVLVATTVVEVGVDVPEATVMVIEDADRFGIAQLHQLRGRVGRASSPSWCYLLSAVDTPESAARLGAVERSGDGFELAEVDLALRGEGTILGARQNGRSDFRLARLLEDRDLVVEARETAEAIASSDPGLAENGLLAEELALFVGEEEAEFLFKS